jgi:GGDEF domain-containing protein
MFTKEYLMKMSKDQLVELVISLKKDSLTGVYRREILSEINKLTYMVVLVDINGLKKTNDMRGHNMGDKLILSVVNDLKRAVSDEDIIVRYGGDEFVIVFENETIFSIKEKMKDIPNISYGVGYGVSMSSAITMADKNMYTNKRRFYKSLVR